MLSNRSAAVDFYKGSCVQIIVSNKPYIDYTVAPDLNDYRDAETTNIKIYNPKDKLIVDAEMNRIQDRPGWYMYNFCTKCEDCLGIYRVEVTLCSDLTHYEGDVDTISTTGTTGTTGCSVDPNVCCDTSVGYFRLLTDRDL